MPESTTPTVVTEVPVPKTPRFTKTRIAVVVGATLAVAAATYAIMTRVIDAEDDVEPLEASEEAA